MKTNQLWFLLCFLTLVFVQLNCNSNPSHGPNPASSFSGTVVDLITGVPIDSAEIIYGDTLSSNLNTYTNSEGRYIISIGRKGIVDVYCRKASYLTEMKTVDLPVDNLIINNFNFKLKQ